MGQDLARAIYSEGQSAGNKGLMRLGQAVHAFVNGRTVDVSASKSEQKASQLEKENQERSQRESEGAYNTIMNNVSGELHKKIEAKLPRGLSSFHQQAARTFILNDINAYLQSDPLYGQSIKAYLNGGDFSFSSVANVQQQIINRAVARLPESIKELVKATGGKLESGSGAKTPKKGEIEDKKLDLSGNANRGKIDYDNLTDEDILLGRYESAS